MSISSRQLDALYVLAEKGNFLAAAQALNITQPSLTKRIQLLEDEVETTLIIRKSSGLELTDAGRRLLEYSRQRRNLEEEVLGNLGVKQVKLGGVVRLIGQSSMIPYLAVPALAPLLRKNDSIEIEFIEKLADQIPSLIKTAQADFYLHDEAISISGINSNLLGYEELVLVESTQHRATDNVYLDTNPNDTITLEFLKKQSKSYKNVKRRYMNNVTGIINGAIHGLGRAVIESHALNPKLPLKIISGYQHTKRPVILYWPQQPYYTKLQSTVLQTLVQEITKILN